MPDAKLPAGLDQLLGSRAFILLAGKKDFEEPELEMTLQVGYAALLDKPFLLLHSPDAVVSEKVRKLADETIVLTGNWGPHLAAALMRLGFDLPPTADYSALWQSVFGQKGGDGMTNENPEPQDEEAEDEAEEEAEEEAEDEEAEEEEAEEKPAT